MENEKGELPMIKSNKYKTTTYEDGDYRIDVVTMPNRYEAYLYHKDCAIKSLMFGADRKTSADEFLRLVSDNLQEYEADYFEEHEDYDHYREDALTIIDDGLFDAAVALMDDEIREEVHNEIAPCTDNAFLYEYMKRHFAKYGEMFRVV